MDQCFGQALVKCSIMGLRPACVFPSDIMLDEVFLQACETHGVIAGDLNHVIGCIEKEIGVIKS